MGEYRCEGMGRIQGGTYDKLHVEGIFTAKEAIKANQVSSEGIMKFSALSAETVILEGVAKVERLLKATSCTVEGILKAGAISVSGNFYSDGGFLFLFFLRNTYLFGKLRWQIDFRKIQTFRHITYLLIDFPIAQFFLENSQNL